MTNKCESCFEIQEQQGTEEFIQCLHESMKTTDSAAHKIGNRFAGIDSQISTLDNRMETAEGAITTLQNDVTVLTNITNEHTNQIASLGDRINTVEGNITILDQSITNVDNRVNALDEASMKKAVYDPAGGARQVQFEQDLRLETEDKTVTGAINSLLANKVDKWVPQKFGFELTSNYEKYTNAEYYLNNHNYIQLNLSITAKNGKVNNRDILAILPEEHRPTSRVVLPATLEGSTKRYAGAISIFTDGRIVIGCEEGVMNAIYSFGGFYID